MAKKGIIMHYVNLRHDEAKKLIMHYVDNQAEVLRKLLPIVSKCDSYEKYNICIELHVLTFKT